jgi:16S rRNA (cytidine1402-2'-O)-methyltransferase
MPAEQTPAAAPGVLYLIATPIGNLEDITLRALRLLREADVIACEDTRRTQKLLSHYQIHKPLVSYHEHNEAARTAQLVQEIARGARVALVTDAGSPAISDPGSHLVRACIARSFPVIPVPGPSALIAALSASGLPADTILFLGFLPPRASERRRRLQQLARLAWPAACPAPTLIFYEAPHRVAATLADCAAIWGSRQAVMARELTKVHEEFLRGSLEELASRVRSLPARGEITLLLGGASEKTKRNRVSASFVSTDSLAGRVQQLMCRQNLDRKAALKQAARELGLRKREAYKQLVVAKQ